MDADKRQVMKDLLDAIKSVRSRAKKAQKSGNHQQFTQLMGDLIALEVCLVDAVDVYIKKVDQAA